MATQSPQGPSHNTTGLDTRTDHGNFETNKSAMSPLSLAIQRSIESIWDVNTKVLHVTLSVSGGCDSVAMLHACMEWIRRIQPSQLAHTNQRPEPSIHVHVVHFNHQQRNNESDKDEEFVQQLCQSYDLPFHVEYWKEAPLEEISTASSLPLSSHTQSFSQDTARQWRRTKLLQYTRQQLLTQSASQSEDIDSTHHSRNVGVILTAHHKDDSMESLLLKAIRGVHLLNLSGMKPLTKLDSFLTTNNSYSISNPFPTSHAVTNDIFFVRPWVQDFDKNDLIKYLQTSGQSWREDESNISHKYLRNRVRHQLVPLLQDLTNGKLQSRLDTWMQQSQQLLDDITPRVNAHLKEVVTLPSSTTKGGFDWGKSVVAVSTSEPTDSATSHPTIVQSQALYQWMTTSVYHQGPKHFEDSPMPIFPHGLVSSDTLQRVLTQLHEHPHQMEWMLELGQGWGLQRKGTMLQMVPPPALGSQASESILRIAWSWQKEFSDSMRDDDTLTTQCDATTANWSDTVRVWIPEKWLEMNSKWQVYLTTVAAYEATRKSNHALLFTPPWRSSPLKLRQFLRGQGIPFHERDDTNLLICSTPCSTADSDGIVLAVQRPSVSNELEWVVDKRYSNFEPENESNTSKIPLVLSGPS